MFNLPEFNILTISILATLSLLLVIQLYYLWVIFGRLAFRKHKMQLNGNPELPPVSVVICAHNEYLNLEKNLPEILGQDYPHFEVVVVNDCSDDGSDELLMDMARTDNRLKVINLTQNLNFFQGKKFPLSVGIKSAHYEHLLLTDADCRPAGNQWISTIIRRYVPGVEIVIGYSPYERHNTFLNLLIRFDTLQSGMLYISRALAGKPYMGVGRNLSYLRTVFMRNKGFTSHYTVPSGDDDLFISQVATRQNSVVEFGSAAQVISKPKTTFSQWVRQKRRHLGAGQYYKTGVKFFLGTYSATILLFYLAVAAAFWALPYYFATAALAIRLISQFIVFARASKRLSDPYPLLLLPFIELFLTIFIPLLLVVNRFVKPNKWM
ncbi:MAG TPA: glycosyltransferase [Bacteroidales bacterium]|nr:glycosyltransferase [Bacteroidales bacterium]